MLIAFQFVLFPDLLSSDGSKLVLFIVVCAVFLFGSRLWFGRSNAANDGAMTTDFTQTPFQLSNQGVGAGTTMTVHPEMEFEKIKLRSFYFSKIDSMSGPPDPFEFADELTVEVEHLANGDRSKWQFTVGTPAGFARLLEREEWESFYSPETFVIRKYELEMVRGMVIEHIESVLDDNTARPRLPDPPPSIG